jgi:hypothetical protein
MSASGVRCTDTSLTGVRDVPDGAGAVIGNEEKAVTADGDVDGTAPDLAIGGDEAGEEVIVFSGGFAVDHARVMTA